MPTKTVSRLTFSLYPHELETIKFIGRHLAFKLGLPAVPTVTTYRQAIQALIEREGLTVPLALNGNNHNNHNSK